MSKQLAKQMRQQADRLEKESERVRKWADKLDPPAPKSAPRRRVVKQGKKFDPAGTSDYYRKNGVWHSRSTGRPVSKRKQGELSKGGA